MPPPTPSQSTPFESPRSFAVAECEDRLALQGVVVRRHFWRRVLPSVGVTSYMAVSVVMGLGTPALVATGVFVVLSLREAARFREKLVRLRGLEAELVSLRDAEAESTPRERA